MVATSYDRHTPFNQRWFTDAVVSLVSDIARTLDFGHDNIPTHTQRLETDGMLLSQTNVVSKVYMGGFPSGPKYNQSMTLIFLY